MILLLLINFVVLIFSTIFIIFPVVTIATIPIFGSFISSMLTLMVQTFNSILGTLPFLVISWSIFKWVIVPFEVFVIVLRFFLGARAPVE